MKKRDRTEYNRAYYAANRERITTYQREWHRRNAERIKEMRKNWPSQYVRKITLNPPLTKLRRPDMRFVGRKWGVKRFDKKAYTREYEQLPERKAARLQRYKERGPRPRPGWTRELRAQVLLEQGGNCAICGMTLIKACQDHDAQTKKPRGLLCTNCNHLLGKAKDSVETLTRALAYLHKYAQE